MATEGLGLPHVSRRTLFRFALAAPLASGLIAAPTLRTEATPAPVRPRVHRRALGPDMFSRVDVRLHRSETGGSLPAGADVRSTGPLAADPFRLAALTWTGSAEVGFVVRTRSVGGRWSGWTRLGRDGHGPDPDSAEARRARLGTDALLVAESSAVEVRIETPGPIPEDLRLELIHPRNSAADAGRASGAGTAAAATILRRADWGADESVRESGNPRYGEVRGAFVHHTAGSNSYTAEDVPGIIRSIYAYHVNGRGWRDIGYNFLVDKFGRIWEGRFGGIDRPVIGAHVAGYNSYAFGVSVLGTYVNTEPEDAALRAFEQVIRWKFDVHNVDPTRVTYPGLKDVPAIAGHRDGGATECPGERLYAKLGTIRGGVANPVDTELTLGAHTAATRAGKRVWFTIDWSADGESVSGRVVLQRLSGSAWVDVRGATVHRGAGVTYDFPHSDQTYRVRTVAVTGAAGSVGAMSAPVALEVRSSESDLTMSQSGPVVNGEIPIQIDWWHGSSGVTGAVELQQFGDGEWVAERTADVVNGAGATVLQPSSTAVYRLRARSASSPQGVEISHPAGTSNEFRAIA